VASRAEAARSRRQDWALPGGRHDRVIGIARNAMPMAIGVLAALLATTPLTSGRDISFVLSKDRVEVARERMRVARAQYRGQDAKGQAFTIVAGSAVQATSRDPVVKLAELTARLEMADGPAVLSGRSGRYDLTSERIKLDGPVRVTGPENYALDARDATLDLKSRTLSSARPVDGTLSIGRFSGGRMQADLERRTVVLEGGVHLHIVQAGGRRR
jgi:lipopolysaccharide export system protein LptC